MHRLATFRIIVLTLFLATVLCACAGLDYRPDPEAGPAYDVGEAFKKIQEELVSASIVNIYVHRNGEYAPQSVKVSVVSLDSYRLLLAGPMANDGNVDGMWAWQLDWSRVNVDSGAVLHVRDYYWIRFGLSMNIGWKGDAGRQHAVDFFQAVRSLQLHAKSGALANYRKAIVDKHSAELEKYRAASSRPALPAEALKYRVQAESAIKHWRFVEALRPYQQASTIAPWWPEGYFNLALVWEELGLYPEAVAYMKYYLLLAPDAPNARAAQNKIFEWEGRSDGEKLPSGKPVFFPARMAR